MTQKRRKMRAVRGWAAIDRKSGKMCDHDLSRASLAYFWSDKKVYRIARILITEVS